MELLELLKAKLLVYLAPYVLCTLAGGCCFNIWLGGLLYCALFIIIKLRSLLPYFACENWYYMPGSEETLALAEHCYRVAMSAMCQYQPNQELQMGLSSIGDYEEINVSSKVAQRFINYFQSKQYYII